MKFAFSLTDRVFELRYHTNTTGVMNHCVRAANRLEKRYDPSTVGYYAMQVGVYLQTFRGTLLPLSSGSKKPNNNSSWKLDVFCNTRIFTSTAVKTSNVAGINVTFASSKADERWL